MPVSKNLRKADAGHPVVRIQREKSISDIQQMRQTNSGRQEG
jgi:hypothetical protein